MELARILPVLIAFIVNCALRILAKETCESYRKCLEKKSLLLTKCEQSSTKELQTLLRELNDCQKKKIEFKNWEAKLHAKLLQGEALCLNTTSSVLLGCPAVFVPFGAPLPVLRRKKRQSGSSRTDIMRTRALVRKIQSRCSNRRLVLHRMYNLDSIGHFKTKMALKEFIEAFCQGDIALDLTEIPDKYDAVQTPRTKNVDAMSGAELTRHFHDRVRKACNNHGDVDRKLKEKRANGDFTTRQDVQEFLTMFCDGNIWVKESEIPLGLLSPVADAEYDFDDHPTFRKFAAKVSSWCSNGDRVVAEVKRVLSTGGDRSDSGSDRAYVAALAAELCTTRRGAARPQITADDLPALIDCITAKRNQCPPPNDGRECRLKREFCSVCMDLSLVQTALFHNHLNEIRLAHKCPKANRR